MTKKLKDSERYEKCMNHAVQLAMSRGTGQDAAIVVREADILYRAYYTFIEMPSNEN